MRGIDILLAVLQLKQKFYEQGNYGPFQVFYNPEITGDLDRQYSPEGSATVCDCILQVECCYGIEQDYQQADPVRLEEFIGVSVLYAQRSK